jgi:hypothetical protein
MSHLRIPSDFGSLFARCVKREYFDYVPVRESSQRARSPLSSGSQRILGMPRSGSETHFSEPRTWTGSGSGSQAEPRTSYRSGPVQVRFGVFTFQNLVQTRTSQKNLKGKKKIFAVG